MHVYEPCFFDRGAHGACGVEGPTGFLADGVEEGTPFGEDGVGAEGVVVGAVGDVNFGVLDPAAWAEVAWRVSDGEVKGRAKG